MALGCGLHLRSDGCVLDVFPISSMRDLKISVESKIVQDGEYYMTKKSFYIISLLKELKSLKKWFLRFILHIKS